MRLKHGRTAVREHGSVEGLTPTTDLRPLPSSLQPPVPSLRLCPRKAALMKGHSPMVLVFKIENGGWQERGEIAWCSKSCDAHALRGETGARGMLEPTHSVHQIGHGNRRETGSWIRHGRETGRNGASSRPSRASVPNSHLNIRARRPRRNADDGGEGPSRGRPVHPGMAHCSRRSEFRPGLRRLSAHRQPSFARLR